jgi:uncharacterized iron-regulated protein
MINAALRFCALTSSLLAAVACGGTTKGPQGPKSGEVRGVRAAALPFKILRARGGQEISTAEFYGELADAQAICVGEMHTNPHHHWVQLQVFDAASAQSKKAGISSALGMEMFQHPFQGVLDDHASGKIDQSAMLNRSGYEDRWGYDWELYRPMVELAVERGHDLLALNTPRELTKKVARKGLDSLTPEERAKLPELNLDDPTHRAWWAELMGSMGGAEGHSHTPKSEGKESNGDGDGEHKKQVVETSDGSKHGAESHGEGEGHGEGQVKDEGHGADHPKVPPAGNIYAAQVLWDETMADRASAWVMAAEKRQVVIFAGNGHCHDSAIVNRMKRRGVERVVSVRPIIDGGDSELADLVATPINDYLFVMSVPK